MGFAHALAALLDRAPTLALALQPAAEPPSLLIFARRKEGKKKHGKAASSDETKKGALRHPFSLAVRSCACRRVACATRARRCD
jgi:hypothetical protein